jgi:hypothetical protein
VIGGYQHGGCTPAISCSAHLGEAIRRLCQQAVADEGTPLASAVVGDA